MMQTKLKDIYKKEFKRLYHQKNYQEAFDLFLQNQEMMRYFSRREKLVMTKIGLDKISSKLDNINNELEKHQLEMLAIKYGWIHGN